MAIKSSTSNFIQIRNMEEFYTIDKVYYFCWDTSSYKFIKKWFRCKTSRYFHTAILVELFDGERQMFQISDLYYKTD